MAIETKLVTGSSASDWTDLGVGPLFVQALGSSATIAIAESKPSTEFPTGFCLMTGAQPWYYPGSSHVWLLGTKTVLHSTSS